MWHTTLLTAALLLTPHRNAGAYEPIGGKTVPRRPPSAGAMARIPAGWYTPLYRIPGRAARMRVHRFALDRFGVTRGEFLTFVRGHPGWRRGRVRPVFAEPGYLSDWPADLDAGTAADQARPVTNVSWFAARAYCAWRGKRLPTTDECEYVAAASETRRDGPSDAAFLRRLVAAYSTPRQSPFPPIGSGAPNAYGVFDMHGPVWEWVLDFNSVLVSDDSRSITEYDPHLFCVGGALGAADLTNYPAFLRYGFRAGLNGRTTVATLGFRCATTL